MERLYNIWSVLVLCVIFVFGASTVFAENPVMNFLGGQSGLVNVEKEVVAEYEEYEIVDKDGTPVYSFINFMSNLFGGSSPSNGQESEDDVYELYEDGGEDTYEYIGPDPTLNCLPNTVVKNEPALIFWQCKDASQTASAIGFSSGGEPHGGVRVNPETSTTYELDCSAGTHEQCHVKVINPAMALISNPSIAATWEKVTLSWNTLDVQSCELNSDDNNSKYKDWQRYGTDSVDGVLSHPITKTTVFTLTCTTLTGLEREKTVTVSVQ